MNEYTLRKLKILLAVVLLAVFVALIVIGQQTVSWASFGLMMIGLVGMLALLYIYNRRHR